MSVIERSIINKIHAHYINMYRLRENAQSILEYCLLIQRFGKAEDFFISPLEKIPVSISDLIGNEAYYTIQVLRESLDVTGRLRRLLLWEF